MRAGKVSVELSVQSIACTQESRQSEYRVISASLFEGGEIMVKVNGLEVDIAGKTISEYIATTEYDPKRIAVERNGDIVFKSQYDVTVLEEGDSLEIVSFVGGG